MFKLLLGFENPDKGNILIDGINIKNLNMQHVRKEFGVVLQTTNLFPGSIFSNIAEESISGGQKQKILIGALATNPKVLLDEATSALDNQSQLVIYKNLKALNITRLVIVH